MVIKVRQEPPGALAVQALWIALLAVGLAVFGLVVQYSAGISLSSSNRTFAFERQAAYLLVALVAGLLCYRLNLERVREFRWWIFGGALVAMLAARIPGSACP
jgi:cell division protein FtsW (lipid II flippase)